MLLLLHVNYTAESFRPRSTIGISREIRDHLSGLIVRTARTRSKCRRGLVANNAAYAITVRRKFGFIFFFKRLFTRPIYYYYEIIVQLVRDEQKKFITTTSVPYTRTFSIFMRVQRGRF
jgi:hypothetical protein